MLLIYNLSLLINLQLFIYFLLFLVCRQPYALTCVINSIYKYAYDTIFFLPSQRTFNDN